MSRQLSQKTIVDLCDRVNPDMAAHMRVDINPDFKALQRIMEGLGKPDTDPTDSLRHTADSMPLWVLKSHLSTWCENHRALVTNVQSLASAMYQRPCGAKTDFGFNGDAVNWLEDCKLNASMKDCEIGGYRSIVPNAITIHIKSEYVSGKAKPDQSDDEDTTTGDEDTTVENVLWDHRIADFPYGRTMEYGCRYNDSEAAVTRYLLLILPSVARKARNMRRCEDCSRLTQQRVPKYYDKALADSCPDCCVNRAAKRLCRGF